MIAAFSAGTTHPVARAREDVQEIIKVLLDGGADPDQRGINDYAALHMAVGEANEAAVGLLLAACADPELRTRIDEHETPLEMAERAGLTSIAALLARSR